uniref:Uncharacterized protein n=1 Tax=Mycena chlorophos TaxID=658473 RepID=A0ABQ0LEP6_MYCCL|nr:predicted protein [Mycena chlorophos]
MPVALPDPRRLSRKIPRGLQPPSSSGIWNVKFLPLKRPSPARPYWLSHAWTPQHGAKQNNGRRISRALNGANLHSKKYTPAPAARDPLQQHHLNLLCSRPHTVRRSSAPEVGRLNFSCSKPTQVVYSHIHLLPHDTSTWQNRPRFAPSFDKISQTPNQSQFCQRAGAIKPFVPGIRAAYSRSPSRRCLSVDEVQLKDAFSGFCLAAVALASSLSPRPGRFFTQSAAEHTARTHGEMSNTGRASHWHSTADNLIAVSPSAHLAHGAFLSLPLNAREPSPSRDYQSIILLLPALRLLGFVDPGPKHALMWSLTELLLPQRNSTLPVNRVVASLATGAGSRRRRYGGGSYVKRSVK